MSISITTHKLKPYNRELPWAGIGKIDPLDKWFRLSDLNIGKINDELNRIPSDASVAATGNVVPHLAFRDHIYYLPHVPKHAEYIVILHEETHYMISQEELAAKIESWKSDPKFRVQFEDKYLIIFKRT